MTINLKLNYYHKDKILEYILPLKLLQYLAFRAPRVIVLAQCSNAFASVPIPRGLEDGTGPAAWAPAEHVCR